MRNSLENYKKKGEMSAKYREENRKYDVDNLKSCGKFLFRVRFSDVILTVSLLPLFGAAYSVIWSLLFNYEACTWTHCKVL